MLSFFLRKTKNLVTNYIPVNSFFSGSALSAFLNHKPSGKENNVPPEREPGGGVPTQNRDPVFRSFLPPRILKTEAVFRVSKHP